MVMPLGDPCGGEFAYTDEGLPVCISAVTIPSTDLVATAEFYFDELGFTVVESQTTRLIMKRGDCVLIFAKSETAGIDTGVYIGVDNPFDLHRRLIDDGVVFIRDPLNSPIGVYTSFRDCCGNIIHAVDRLGKVERVSESRVL